MNRFNKILITYFLIFIPLLIVAICFNLGEIFYHQAKTNILLNSINTMIGVLLLLWLLTTIYLSISLIFSQPFREQLLSKIMRLKERDEREVLQTALISKKVYLTSIAIISFLFVLSSLQINVVKLPEPTTDGKQHALSMGVKFSMWKESTNTDLYAYQFPMSAQGILILLLALQLGLFYFYSRKMQIE